MKLICITGIDGGGKSTLAKGLAAGLNGEGIRAQYLYGRIKPVLALFIMKLGRFFFIRKQDPWADYHAYSDVKIKRMKNPFLRFVYLMAVYTDLFVQVWLKMLPCLFRPRVVILDRYVYDTVISDLAVHLGYTHDEVADSVTRALQWVPNPALNFLIDLPEEVAFSRKTDVPNIDYLRERRTYFQTLGKRLGFTFLDGECPAEELVQKALRMVGEMP